MDRLLIIADDFTGALDTGIQFTKMGVRARTVTDFKYDFRQVRPDDGLLSVNTDSRPLTAPEAYGRVFYLAMNARNAGIQYVYKKTDSGLRGNLGVELKAVMDAYEENTIAFIPALPSQNRITRGGVAYIDGVPVKDSVFGKDPFEPVQHSDVAEIIRSQTDLQVIKIPRDAYESADFDQPRQTVLLFDAETEEDLLAIARMLRSRGQVKVTAGCAGFASVYDKMLDFEKGSPHFMQECDGLLSLCGSVNQITVKQLDYAEAHGFTRRRLSNEEKIQPEFENHDAQVAYYDQLFEQVKKTDRFLVDTLDIPGEQSTLDYIAERGMTLDDIRFKIADTLGLIAREMVERNLNYTISMTGGDTLVGFMRCIGRTELVPVREIGKGAVLSILRWNGKRIQVISKSGGFGDEDIFEQMYETVIHFKGGYVL